MSSLAITPAEPAWAAFAAIGLGLQNHSWSLLPAGSSSAETGKTRQHARSRRALGRGPCRDLPQVPSLRPREKRGAVVYMLSKYDHLILFPVPPSMSASYRGRFLPLGRHKMMPARCSRSYWICWCIIASVSPRAP